MSEQVDYVIVGAGTAGCVLAARLSEDPDVAVALLEFGGTDSNPAIWDTSLASQRSLWAPDARENWGYQTVPQPGLHGRSIPIARGKILGGCSAINAMIYMRGNRRDFDGWSQLGNQGWGYAEVLPYFKKSEKYHGPASDFHGRDGPVSVIDYRQASPVSHAFVEAAAELGHANRYNDFNASSQEGGAGFCQSTRTPLGVRVTAASAFLAPNGGRGNLRVLTNARATRLAFDRGRVTGVEYVTQGRLESIRAEREVVLCCGAFETPKLMMLSGLGPAAQLAAADIRVVQDLSGVGQNLQDHLLLGVGFESQIPLGAPELLAEAALFTWSRNGSRLLAPDLQYFFVPIQFVPGQYQTSAPGFTFIPILAQPTSRGTVTLASNDPTTLARVDPRYLSTDEDIAVLEYGIRYARELAHTKPFDALRGRELAPGKNAMGTSELRDFIRRNASTVWHPSGTCKMGTDHDAVVDDELRVRGVEGLRIADASIMPRLISGNPNAAILMIAEKAAELIARRQPEAARRSPEEDSCGICDGGSASTASSGPPDARAPAGSLVVYREKVSGVIRGAIADRSPKKHLYDIVARQLARAQGGTASAICLATCGAFGGDEEQALPSAAAIELVFQAIALHEELGNETDQLPERGLRSKQGVPLNLNAGDAMSALGVRMLRQSVRHFESGVAGRLLGEFDRISAEAVEGRAVELGWWRGKDRGALEESYLLMVLKKRSWGGFIGPARIGALVATAGTTDLERFNRFGHFLGLAFEIGADVRHLTRVAEQGAPLRNEPFGSKMTLILAHLVESCGGAERDQLELLLQQPRRQRSLREISWINAALRTHGSIDYAREAARRFAQQAREELEKAYAGAPPGAHLAFLRSLPDLGAGSEGSHALRPGLL